MLTNYADPHHCILSDALNNHLQHIKLCNKILLISINLPFHLINSVLCQWIHIAKSNVKLVRGYRIENNNILH